MSIDMDQGTTAIREGSDDPKRARILDGALKVFLAYGYSRTRMDDIARAAELSRPALYLIFRNKADIYREIARCLMGHCLEQSRKVFACDAPLLTRIDRMCDEVMAVTLRGIKESPHGDELLDMKSSLAGEIMAQWRTEMDAMLERVFAREASEAGVDLAARGISARLIAETYIDALEGVELRFSDPSDHPARAKAVARILVAALRP